MQLGTIRLRNHRGMLPFPGSDSKPMQRWGLGVWFGLWWVLLLVVVFCGLFWGFFF